MLRLRAADPLGGELPPALPHPPALPARASRRRGPWRPLVLANLALLAAVGLHGIDHAFRQPGGMGALTTEVFGGGIAMGVAAALSLAFALAAHRFAPKVAATAGPWIALAVAASHFPPRWSAFSDPYAEIGVDALSYALAIVVILAGVAVGLAGLRAARAAPA
jgi:hypothetical protein